VVRLSREHEDGLITTARKWRSELGGRADRVSRSPVPARTEARPPERIQGLSPWDGMKVNADAESGITTMTDYMFRGSWTVQRYGLGAHAIRRGTPILPWREIGTPSRRSVPPVRIDA
jgi:hypothetical protein